MKTEQDLWYEQLKSSAVQSNPVAMPAPYGYAGQEDCGDPVAAAGRKIAEETISDVIKDVMTRQVSGNHYKVAAIQPWDVMAAYGLDPWSANVLKYLLRFPYKAGRQDLEKAKHYIEYLITHYDEVNDTYYNK